MRLTSPIVAAAGLAAAVACGAAAVHIAALPASVVVRPAASVSPAPASGPTVTVVGTGTAAGTPDQASMSFGVEVTSGSAAAALSQESAAARKLLNALEAAGIAQKDIQTQWLSLYRDPQRGGFVASSSVSATIRDLSRAGSTIDAAVAAAGDSVTLGGISLSISDTSGLMAAARKDAVSDAQSRAQQYAQAAGLKLGGIVSISETDSSPSPIFYGAAQAAPAAGQPIEPGQQTLRVAVTVVYALNQ